MCGYVIFVHFGGIFVYAVKRRLLFGRTTLTFVIRKFDSEGGGSGVSSVQWDEKVWELEGYDTCLISIK